MQIDPTIVVKSLSPETQKLLPSIAQYTGQVTQLGGAVLLTVPWPSSTDEMDNLVAVSREVGEAGVTGAVGGITGKLVAFVLEGQLVPDPNDPVTQAYNNMVDRLNDMAAQIDKSVQGGTWPDRALVKYAIGEFRTFLETPIPKLPGGLEF